MPLYEYRCGRKHTTEKIRPMEDRDCPIVCPECRQLYNYDNYARRIMSTYSFQFSQFLQELEAGTII